jgi:hypothetical protein
MTESAIARGSFGGMSNPQSPSSISDIPPELLATIALAADIASRQT